jgi:hypothetical protein
MSSAEGLGGCFYGVGYIPTASQGCFVSRIYGVMTELATLPGGIALLCSTTAQVLWVNNCHPFLNELKVERSDRPLRYSSPTVRP